MLTPEASPSVQTDTFPTRPTAEQIAEARQFEAEQFTRRQALRKIGFGAGLAAFFMLSTDDMAHMVGKVMEKRAGDNKIAHQVAKELENAGAAEAGWFGLLCDSCVANCTATSFLACKPCDGFAHWCGGFTAKPLGYCYLELSLMDCEACCAFQNAYDGGNTSSCIANCAIAFSGFPGPIDPISA